MVKLPCWCHQLWCQCRVSRVLCNIEMTQKYWFSIFSPLLAVNILLPTIFVIHLFNEGPCFPLSFLAGWKYSPMHSGAWGFGGVCQKTNPNRKDCTYLLWMDRWGQQLWGQEGELWLHLPQFSVKHLLAMLLNPLQAILPSASEAPWAFPWLSLHCCHTDPSSRVVTPLNQFLTVALHTAAWTAARPWGRQWCGSAWDGSPDHQQKVHPCLGGRVVYVTFN